MRFELVKDVIFRNEKIHPILATMDDKTKDAFFLHFYYYPVPFSFTRVVDNAKVSKTVEEFISLLPADEDGVNRLIEFFFIWKERFDGFEKKILDILSENPGQQEYLFLRSSTFLNNRESWKKKGIEDSRDKIEKSYSDYLHRRWRADESLGKYYIIKDNYDSKILANKYTHQLYHLIKTVDVSGFASGQGFSLVSLMIKYEEVYETPIEEHEIWDGEIWLKGDAEIQCPFPYVIKSTYCVLKVNQSFV